MTRQHFLKKLLGLAVAPLAVPAWASAATGDGQERVIDESIPKLEKRRSEWRGLLSRDQYEVLFKAATEHLIAARSIRRNGKVRSSARRATCRCSIRPPSTRVERAGPASTRRSRVAWAPRRTTGWSCPGPNITASAAVVTRGTCSTTGLRPPVSDGATTASRSSLCHAVNPYRH